MTRDRYHSRALGAARQFVFRRGSVVERFAVSVATVAALLSSAGFAPQEVQRANDRIATPAIPAEAASMVEAAQRAVILHRPGALAAFAELDAADQFAWSAGKEHEWKADVLPVPGSGSRVPTFLAVFHAFHTCESDGDHVYRLVRTLGAGRPAWRLGPEIPETETLGLRVRDHAINASVDVPRKTVELRDAVAIERTQGEQNPFGLLRINEGYRVRSLRNTETGAAVPYEQSGGVLAFIPPETDRFTLLLDYGARLDHANGDYVHEDEAVIASYWYPQIARLPATLSVTVTAPAGWTPIAQGEPIGTTVNGDGSKTVSWRNDVPTSFFTLDMGRYHVTSRLWRGRLLSAYLLDSNSVAAGKSLDLLQESLAFYDQTFGPFPYRRFALVETRGPFNGALEAYSFATFGPRTLPEFIPHEVSHTWWGGLVPCTYLHSMWNEAFANYSDDLFGRLRPTARRGVDEAAAAIQGRLQARKRGYRSYAAISLAGAYDTEDQLQSAVGYGKGSDVLRLLEEQIGQERMLAAMRAFVANHPRGQAADWPEFEAAASKAAGEDLRWFFSQWIDRAGVPVIRLTNVIVRHDGPDTVIEGQIIQTGSVYRLRMPVQVELRTGAVVRQTVEVKAAQAPFAIRVAGSPDRLRLDPDAIIPMRAGADGTSDAEPFTYVFQ